MARLFVANASPQVFDFAYRIPGESSYRMAMPQRIEAGQQVPIMGEAPLAVLEAIVEQHRPYGIVSAEEAVRAKGFVRLIFSFDKPVPAEVISYCLDHDKGVLFDLGERQRREMAVAIDGTFERELRRPMRAVELEFLEDRPPHEDSDRQMAEGLRVVHDQTLASEGGVRAGRGNR